MPHYPQTRLLESLVCPTPGRLRQQVELPTEHPLSVEQREGITAQRLVEIVQRLLHPDA